MRKLIVRRQPEAVFLSGMDQRLEPQSVEAVAARLKAIRETTGLNQSDFAKRAHISYTSWNNYETADSLISVVSARKVRRFTGASLDYIYEGVPSHLPAHLAEKLDTYGWRDAG